MRKPPRNPRKGEALPGSPPPARARKQRPRSGHFAADFERFFSMALDMLCVAGMDGYFRRVNAAFEATLGHTEEELTKKPFLDFVHPDDVEGTLAEMGGLNQGRATLHFENRYRCKDGSYKWLAWRATPSEEEGLIYAVARDVTGQKEDSKKAGELQAELERRVAERTRAMEVQLERINALRKIDLAILGSVDLRVALNVFLDQVTSQLGVDAAAVLLPNPSTGALEYAAGRGFTTREIRRSSVPLGKGYAGRAALERATLHVPDLSRSGFCRPELVEAERFVSYYGVPLIAKGRVRGVLDVFHRWPLKPDEDWLEYLETLAGQVAIAIDNTSLFLELERSNVELRLAYDATLEGWVRALDLRDHETEGHTLRVAELTVRLAKQAGIPGEDLIHVRRGALLHDIGKIGIPDEILLKPGKLTEDEMQRMRMHPVFAFQWLSPIKYLRPALDIPYYHHEKWDGTGYPLGLSGQMIPLAARVFAVVDVWDALTSDRPYRKAWPAERALEYIRSEAGKHFDPEVVDAFIQMAGELQGAAEVARKAA